jgi:hypothetical protein
VDSAIDKLSFKTTPPNLLHEPLKNRIFDRLLANEEKENQNSME